MKIQGATSLKCFANETSVCAFNTSKLTNETLGHTLTDKKIK